MEHFNGFTKETFRFFQELKLHNDREWFEAHKDEFQRHVLVPAQLLVVELGKRLQDLAPDIIAIPRVDKAIFRIHRDVRFSANKAPYKTHLAIFMWEGNRKKLENPGFYLHLEPGKLFMGVGLHQFPKDILELYRETILDDRMGEKLESIISELTALPGVTVGTQHYKKVPRGYPSDHPRADLLRYNGLHAAIEEPLPKEVYSPDFVEYCYQRYEKLAPLHYWLREMLGD